jgi:hypothetical protein
MGRINIEEFKQEEKIRENLRKKKYVWQKPLIIKPKPRKEDELCQHNY